MIKDLRKFELYRVFMSALDGAFEPVRCTAEDRRQWLVRLEQLKGTTPYEEFDSMVEFMIAWGLVREVRRYDGGLTLVRYEVSELLYGDDDTRRYQLLVRYSKRGRLLGYTVIHERGRAEHIMNVIINENSKGNGFRTSDTKDKADVLSFVDVMQKDDFVIVIIGDDLYNMAQAYANESDPHPEFTVEWQCGSLMWQCALETKSREQVRNFFEVYMNEGLGAAQLVFKKWRLVNWNRAFWREKKKIEIDRFLSAQLLCAIRFGNDRVVKQLNELGISSDLESIKANKLEVCVKGGTDEERLKQLRKMVKDLEPVTRKKVLAYLSIKAEQKRERQ